MKLVIVGNGFDIHHNYKTSFNNFREFLIENKNKKLVEKIDKFTTEALTQNINSSFKKEELMWNQFEELLSYYHTKQQLNAIQKFDNNSEYMNMIDLLDEFTEEFFHYIKKTTSIQTKVNNEVIAKELNGADLIITFNYTNTISNYQLKSSVKIFHINGSLTEGDLPIIGYYQLTTIRNSVDYLEKHNNLYYSKTALAFKRNSIDYNQRFSNIIKSYKKKIDEFVTIGFSFGNSDSHIKEIIQQLIVSQVRLPRMPQENYDKFKKVSFKVFNYNEKETNIILTKLRLYFPVNQTTITGIGFKKEIKDLITFSKVNY